MITDPFDPKTFPNLTATNSVFDFLLNDWIIISQILFVAPITFVGFTALSVDIRIKRFAPYLSATLAVFKVMQKVEKYLFWIWGNQLK